MAIQFVQSNQVFEVNGQSFGYPAYPNGIQKSISCRSEVVGAYWFTPRVFGNRVLGYETTVATDSNKPTPDSFKIMRVKDAFDANTEFGFAIADSDGVTGFTWVDNCNGCCGDTPVMANVTIPAPILQLPPQTANDGTNTFVFPFPANPNGCGYSIPSPWFNGVAPVTPFDTTGITTAAQFVTWADANWGDYGEWSSSGDIVTLVSIDGTDTVFVVLAGLDVSLVAKPYCFNLTSFSTPAAVNGVQFGSSAIIPFAPFMMSNTNRQTLINRLTPLMPTATFSTTVANKLQVNTVQAQPKLYNDSTLVATATSGVCS